MPLRRWRNQPTAVTITFTADQLAARVAERGEAYRVAVLGKATLQPDGRYQISDAAAADLAADYILARRNPAALAAWQEAGRPLRTEKQHAALKTLCEGCEDHHCRLVCSTTPILRWMATAGPVGPHCLWPAP